MSLLARLRELIEPDRDDANIAPEEAVRLAAALLLVEVARADHDDDPAEQQVLAEALAAEFGLGRAAAEDLLLRARQEQAEAVSLDAHLRVINDHWSAQDKRRLLAAAWRVAYADGVLHAYEEALMRRIAELLFLPHADFIRTKHEVLDVV